MFSLIPRPFSSNPRVTESLHETPSCSFRLVAPQTVNQPPDTPRSRVRNLSLLKLFLVDVRSTSRLGHKLLCLVRGGVSVFCGGRQTLARERSNERLEGVDEGT